MSTLYFDDLFPEMEVSGGSRTVTDAEIALLPAFMGVVSPLFHDEETAKRGRFGGRVLYGPALLGIAIGLTEPVFKDAALGLVALDAVRFLTPVRLGDTVTARLAVRELTPSTSRPAGRVVVEDTIVNQSDEAVLTFSRILMLRSREDPAP